MSGLMRTIHVLAVALWFGSVAFFTIAGVLIFRAFEQESMKEAEQRDKWFPVPAEYARPTPPDSGFPDPLRKEQGSRAAGVAVGGIFPTYFALQAGCAGVAVLTALLLALMHGGRLNGVRLTVCVLGLAAVLAGWWLERKVHELRVPRNELTEKALTAEASARQIEEAKEARQEFGRWHGISLLVNFATLGLALTATALAGHHRQSG